MTQTYETNMNPFIGSACGNRGKVVVSGNALFTVLKVVTVIPKQRAFVNDWPMPEERQGPSNAELLRMADRFSAPQEWYDE
jgi:hypothetical protein